MAVTFRNRIGGWVLMANALKPKLTEMPELASQHAELEKTIAAAQALANEQEELRGTFLKTLRTRLVLEEKGEDQRNRLGASLKGKFGFSAEDLTAYGIKPKKRVRRSSQKATKGTETAPSPHPAPAATPTAKHEQ